MPELIPCKHLDYSDGYKDAADIETHDVYPHVKFWRRKPVWTNNGEFPDCVQFCGQGRGRINSIFNCYEKGFMSCYDPEESK